MGNDRIIPNWIPIAVPVADPSGQMRPAATGTVQQASKPQVTQVPRIAEGAVIPIIYGGPERVAGMPYTVGLSSDGTALIASYLLCEGEVDLIATIQLNDADPPAGCSFTSYTGTATQGVDPWLADAIPGYAETLANTAYIVAKFPAGVIKTFPNLTATVVGLKIPDSRNNNPPRGWDNPALILSHFMQTYARRVVNIASVNAAADWADVPMGSTRRTYLTLTLNEARDVNEWVEVLRGYLPAWVVERDGQWFIYPDVASAPVADYNADTDATTDGDAPMVLTKRGARDAPNVVEVEWTDRSVIPWTTRKATAEVPGLGTGERRKTTLSMPGIREYAQAYRFAVERLNHYTLESIEGDISVMDEGIAIVPGDIVTITDSAHGWDTKQVRVLRAGETDNGRWSLHFREFNAAAYSSATPAAPPPPNSGTLPNPRTVATITGLTAKESLNFESAVIGNDGIARGLIWQSRLEASWTASPDVYFDLYEIRLSSPVMTQPAISASRLPQFSSPPLVQGATYTIDVRVINTLGFASGWVSASVTMQGKQTPPGDVIVIDFAAEVGGECIFRWHPVADPDVVRYEWRGLATSATTAAWDSMTALDRPDTNYTRIKGIAPGQTLFAIKAIDSVGRYSVNPYFVSLLVTSDASAFLQNYNFTPQVATSTNIVQQNFALNESGTRALPRWISKGQAFWNAALPNPVSSRNAPVVNAWGRTAAFKLLTDQYDFGLTLDATVNVNLSGVTATAGAPVVYIANSVDGSTWDYSQTFALVQGAVNGWRAVKVTARFVRIEIWSAANTDAIMVEGVINVQIGSQSRKESGAATSVASGPYRVNLAQKYSKAVSITITPKGTTAASASYDNVIVGLAVTPNSFDVYMFNSSAVQIARDFAWTWQGV